MKASGTNIESSAKCVTCTWRTDARNALAVGSLHAERHRHRVVVVELRTVYFNGQPPSVTGTEELTLL